jgi:hypothetical protein
MACILAVLFTLAIIIVHDLPCKGKPSINAPVPKKVNK